MCSAIGPFAQAMNPHTAWRVTNAHDRNRRCKTTTKPLSTHAVPQLGMVGSKRLGITLPQNSTTSRINVQGIKEGSQHMDMPAVPAVKPDTTAKHSMILSRACNSALVKDNDVQ
jgi:hypothetical protein